MTKNVVPWHEMFCLLVQQTDTRMHTVIDAFTRRFAFLRSSLDYMIMKF